MLHLVVVLSGYHSDWERKNPYNSDAGCHLFLAKGLCPCSSLQSRLLSKQYSTEGDINQGLRTDVNEILSQYSPDSISDAISIQLYLISEMWNMNSQVAE